MSGATRRLADDLGYEVDVPHDVRRIVSIVPSLTESVAASTGSTALTGDDAQLLVGATDWCTHPEDLDARGVARVRGTKNPDLDRIVDLAPDLVLANVEENRRSDVEALRAKGLAVWVTDVRTVDGDHGAVDSLGRMLDACGLGRPAWLDEVQAAWGAVQPLEPRRRAVVPIWRRPWMAVGSDTFTGAVLARLGVDNVLDGSAERYPKVVPAELPPHDLVVLPDEPYLFTAQDGPEAFPGVACALVSGRHLTWYGPSLVEAPRVLSHQLADARLLDC